MSAWYYVRDGHPLDPSTNNSGQFGFYRRDTRTTQMWREGMTDWAEAHATELRALFGPTVTSHVATADAHQLSAPTGAAGVQSPSTLAAWVKD